MSKRNNHEMLVVDGYNVIFGTPRYKDLMDENPGAPSRLGNDPFDRARELLVADVAAFAQGRYNPVIVFDAAGNLNEEHPELNRGGVRMVFSPKGVSADTVIEKLVWECREEERDVTVVTSDGTIRATVGGMPVTCLSSTMLIREIQELDVDREVSMADRPRMRMTMADRLDPETLAKLNKMIGRS